ncbi:hypothetical protein AYO39_02380 [Actinobacteria bacterium SCGC AG-212-D09]|nr:hypothetical protein AYO39_02380 [Actinobacteria bacterium SCGC AG-212-D09]
MTRELLTDGGFWEALAQISITLLVAIVVQEAVAFRRLQRRAQLILSERRTEWLAQTRLDAMEEELQTPPRAATPAQELLLELREQDEAGGFASRVTKRAEARRRTTPFDTWLVATYPDDSRRVTTARAELPRVRADWKLTAIAATPLMAMVIADVLMATPLSPILGFDGVAWVALGMSLFAAVSGLVVLGWRLVAARPELV